MCFIGIVNFNCLDAIPRVSAYFGPGIGVILRQYLLCTGDERRLVDCPSTTSSCSHNEDAGVSCLPTSKIKLSKMFN